MQTIEYTLPIGEEPSVFEGRVVASDYEDEAVMIVRDITEQKQMEMKSRPIDSANRCQVGSAYQ